VELPLVNFRNGITLTEREANAKGTPHHYRRTTILIELFDNKTARSSPDQATMGTENGMNAAV
jgi:hypothetical protein